MVKLKDYVDALLEAERRHRDMRFDELEKSVDRRFGAQYNISGRLLAILGGLGVFVTIITAVVKWNL